MSRNLLNTEMCHFLLLFLTVFSFNWSGRKLEELFNLIIFCPNWIKLVLMKLTIDEFYNPFLRKLRTSRLGSKTDA